MVWNRTFNRLQLRKHSYYVRVSLPQDVQKLVKKKEIRYTLNTKDYYEAIHLVRRESYKIDLLIASLRKLCMRIEEGTIVLTDAEIRQFMVYRMREIDHFFSFQDADALELVFEQLSLFSDKDVVALQKHYLSGKKARETKTKIQAREEKVQTLFESYISSLRERKDCKATTRRLIDDVFNADAKVLNTKRIEAARANNDEYGNNAIAMISQLAQLDDYARQRYAKVLKKKDRQGKGYSLFADALLKASRKLDEEEMTAMPSTNTKWEDAFADMIRPEKNAGAIKETTFEEKRQCIKMIMSLIGKEYIEQLTYEDCQDLNKLIYLVPKNIHKKYPNKRLSEALLENEDDRENGLSMASIAKYLNIFKQFLKFCRRQRLLDEDLADVIDTPRHFKGKNTYMPFTDGDLEKIFNPITYCKYTRNGKDAPKFFVTLIALFSGARINEICQVRLEDIKEEDGIVYIQTEDKHSLQSLKNTQSKRRIPLHPMLKEMGLITYINKMRRKNEEWLFPTLLKQYNPKYKFAKNVSRGFTSYLKQLGIKEKRKVFHSFRHTVRPKLRDECHLSQEYIDALCGWEAGGNAGATTYSHKDKIPIKTLYRHISKLKYPKLNTSFKKITERVKIMNRHGQ